MTMVKTRGGAMDVEQTGQGRDLVLLHSLLTDRSAFDRVRPLLAARHRLTLVNLPSYGQSAPAEASLEAYAQRVADTMEALHLPRQTDVLGNGLGGFIAQVLAMQHGERFERLVIVDAHAGFPEAGKAPLRNLAAAVRASGMEAVLDAAIERMFPPAYIQAHPGEVRERKRALRQMSPDAFAGLCLALAQVNLEPQLAGIRQRTLVCAGALDATTVPELVRKLAQGIPQARFVELPGCGHCPQIEQPEALVAVLEEFLGEAPSAVQGTGLDRAAGAS